MKQQKCQISMKRQKSALMKSLQKVATGSRSLF